MDIVQSEQEEVQNGACGYSQDRTTTAQGHELRPLVRRRSSGNIGLIQGRVCCADPGYQAAKKHHRIRIEPPSNPVDEIPDRADKKREDKRFPHGSSVAPVSDEYEGKGPCEAKSRQ
mmetsp:Transcript_9549/g.13347  ORF Transcript_9549/g.13347 Transcript_9549/m.13347 type:complete len:117 (+) Transcript_9549:30-380(+)